MMLSQADAHALTAINGISFPKQLDDDVRYNYLRISGEALLLLGVKMTKVSTPIILQISYYSDMQLSVRVV